MNKKTKSLSDKHNDIVQKYKYKCQEQTTQSKDPFWCVVKIT